MAQIHFQVTFSLPLPSGGYFVPINGKLAAVYTNILNII